MPQADIGGCPGQAPLFQNPSPCSGPRTKPLTTRQMYSRVSGSRREPTMRIRAPLAFATIVLALATIASARQIHFATAKNTSTGGTQPDCIGIGDFNRNGKLDAAVTNQGSNTLTTFLGFGNGTFQPAVIHGLDPDPIAFPACLVVGDF